MYKGYWNSMQVQTMEIVIIPFWINKNNENYFTYSSVLKVEVIYSSKTLGFLLTTRHYNSEDNSLHSHHCENLKSNIITKICANIAYTSKKFSCFGNSIIPFV
jgi:hypothetical protein